jgi:hypothetical protein
VTFLLGLITLVFAPTGSDTDEEKRRRTEKVIVDLGSGSEGLWARELKARNPDARVIATESNEFGMFELLKRNLAGSGVEVREDWDSIESNLAGETWAVFPEPSLRVTEGVAGLRITKLGGIFHMVLPGLEVGESKVRAIVNAINPNQNWAIGLSTLAQLGIPTSPASYYGPNDHVWYITTIK